MNKFTIIGFFLIFALSCKTSTKEKEQEQKSKLELAPSPNFNQDSAYSYIEKQVAFGPRVPNTISHKNAGNWIIAKLKSYGLEVTEQNFKPVTYDGKVLNARNIIASSNPNAKKRILLAAHWDSRPFADKDTERQNLPIDGANDGGSGVAVLLEIARNLAKSEIKPKVGIDFIFFDAEDWGAPQNYSGKPLDKSQGYCLGSYYWAENLHKENYSAFYGILLDMVGAQDATFRKEHFSTIYAPSIVEKVWSIGSNLGYGKFFLPEAGDGLTDDHIPVNEIAKIPMIDIIDLKNQNSGATFFSGHHTHNDNLSSISKETLKAVGQTVTQTLYNEE